MRVVSGVILGYLIFAGSAFLLFHITQHDPHAPASISFEIGAIVFGVLFAALGGFIASFIGGRRDMLAAKCVAVILALGAIISMIATVVSWSQIWAVLAMAPAVLLGGWLYRIKVSDK
ncbi:MAG TPA: hypothetical protein VHV77_01715 [Pirellulales bacterium]|jgi:nitrate/nitrite transporter NarK|nr:hypothetical protein [Pirellulales bacterium]